MSLLFLWGGLRGSFFQQGKIEGAGFPFDAFRPDPTVMGFDDGLADRQTQAGSLRFADTGRRHRGKFIEDGF